MWTSSQLTSSVLAPCLLMLGGCTTTASREMVLAIQNYDARSREAISAVETIENRVMEQPVVADSDAERAFIDDILNPEAPISEAYVVNRLHPFALSVAANPPSMIALAEMRCVHGMFTQSFAKVESAGILGKRIVADTSPAVLDQLVAQQIYLAKLVQSPDWVKLLGRRNALVARIAQVRNDDGSPDDKEAQIKALRAEWIALEAEEDQLRRDAVGELVKAAATGAALRNQMLAYGKWSLSDLTDSAGALTAFIAAASGRDLSALDGKVEEVRQRVANDPDFSLVARSVLDRIPVPGPASTLTASVGTGPASASSSPTPCLDRQAGG